MKAVVKKEKSLPPWLQKDGEDTKVKGKAAVGPKGAAAKVTVPKKMADGGKVEKVASTATKPKAAAGNFKKAAGNAKSDNVLHLKDGGKMKGC
jgi:hypothetical protein